MAALVLGSGVEVLRPTPIAAAVDNDSLARSSVTVVNPGVSVSDCRAATDSRVMAGIGTTGKRVTRVGSLGRISAGKSGGHMYPPGPATGCTPENQEQIAPGPSIATVPSPPQPPLMLRHEIIVEVEKAAKVQFSLLVMDRGGIRNYHADLYRTIGVEKFLQLKSPPNVHILCCVSPGRMGEIVQHTKQLPGLGDSRRRVYFVVSAGDCTNLTGLSLPVEVCSFPPGTVAWGSQDCLLGAVKLPPTTSTLRVFGETTSKACVLYSLGSLEVLTVKAEILQSSINLLLDTGASANFI